MEIGGLSSLLTLIGVLTAIGGVILSFFRIVKEIRKSKKAVTDKILDEAKEYDLILKSKLDAKIDRLELELDNLKTNVQKDFENIKDSHSLELKNLGDKLESLRTQLNEQHSQLMSILVKMIDK